MSSRLTFIFIATNGGDVMNVGGCQGRGGFDLDRYFRRVEQLSSPEGVLIAD